MLTSFETKISLQTPLFLLTAAGFVLTRCGVISAAGRKSLSSVLIAFILPCSIAKSFQIYLSGGCLASCLIFPSRC